MNIREACLKAKKEGRGITRKSYGSRPTMFLPTNSTYCTMVFPFDENKFSFNRWAPSLSDLIADDWYVYG